jgi:peptidyl-prolyl cis-trans isomerase SurA
MLKQFNLVLILLLSLGNFTLLHAEEKNYKIIKLVNEKVITNYDLEQRIVLYSMLNQGNTADINELASKILYLMVDELLQLEQIKKYNISVSDIEIDEYIDRAYLNADNDIDDFNLIIKKNNLDINILRKSIEIKLGWNNLAGRLFYRTSEINSVDLKNTMDSDPYLSKEQAENNLLQKQISLRAQKLLRDIRTEATIENR